MGVVYLISQPKSTLIPEASAMNNQSENAPKLDELIEQVEAQKKFLSEGYKYYNNLQSLLKQLLRLDHNRDESLSKIKALIGKIKSLLKAQPYDSTLHTEIEQWLKEYESEITTYEEKLRKEFGIRLEEALKRLGFSLTGNYPKYKAGLFTIEVSFERDKAIVWYGPEQEKMGECILSPNALANQISKWMGDLGSKIPEVELIKKIQMAYQRIIGKGEEEVPITKLLPELAYLLQDERFYREPKAEHYKGYSRADFSYDLYRVQKVHPGIIRLRIATRADTRDRSRFLWVPENEKGNGSTYSHIRIEEGA